MCTRYKGRKSGMKDTMFTKIIFGILTLPFLIAGGLIGLFNWTCALPVLMIVCFVFVGVMPFARNSEPLWMFILTILSCLPWDVRFSFSLHGFFDSQLLSLLYNTTIFYVLISAEILASLYITNLIWKKDFK